MSDQIRNGFKEARISKGLSKMDLASKFKINVTIIDGWESGILFPSIEQLRKLSILLNVSTDMLLLSEKRKPLIIGNLNSKDKESVRRLYQDIK